MYGRSQHAVR